MEPKLIAHGESFARRLARVHDYRCQGLEHLPEGPCLMVGYHGRPSLDIVMMGYLIRQHRGRMPVAIGHKDLLAMPGLGPLISGFGVIDGTPEGVQRAVTAGERLLVMPGGAPECWRSSHHRYTLHWGERRGYARLAIRHRLPIVPFAASGVDDLYTVYGEGNAISRRLTGTDMLPLSLVIGHRGVPFGAPRPVQIHQHIGPAILPPPPTVEGLSEPGVRRLDGRVRAAVRTLLRRAVNRPIPKGQGWAL